MNHKNTSQNEKVNTHFFLYHYGNQRPFLPSSKNSIKDETMSDRLRD